jgi:hypothetical protein
LRKGLKIKSLSLLLAWLVIFAHGVIPHHHVDELIPECHSVFHRVSADIGKDENPGAYKNTPSEETVCHYSGFIFGHLGSDNQVLISEGLVFIGLPGSTSCGNLYTTLFFKTDSHTGISFLRAPPGC